jgi:hypothetical protein
MDATCRVPVAIVVATEVKVTTMVTATLAASPLWQAAEPGDRLFRHRCSKGASGSAFDEPP